MPEDTKGFETNVRAVWDAYVFCNQLTENNDLLDLVGSYLPHGQYVVYEIQSKLFIAVKEHLHDVPPADPNQTVKVALPQKYQEDLAILHTLAIRLNTLEKGTGACFHFSREHIDAMVDFVNSELGQSGDFFRNTQALSEILSKAQTQQINNQLTIIGPKDGPEEPDVRPNFVCDPETMLDLYLVWRLNHAFLEAIEVLRSLQSLFKFQYSEGESSIPPNPYTWAFANLGIFGCPRRDSSQPTEWNLATDGLLTNIERELMKKCLPDAERSA
jgi:hypothetical protein